MKETPLFIVIIWLVLLFILSMFVVMIFYSQQPNDVSDVAIAVLNTRDIKGNVLFSTDGSGIRIKATFTKLEGVHGFHIHKKGDLRIREGCDLFQKELGNITAGDYTYYLEGLTIGDLLGRSIVIHADLDDTNKTKAMAVIGRG